MGDGLLLQGPGTLEPSLRIPDLILYIPNAKEEREQHPRQVGWDVHEFIQGVGQKGLHPRLLTPSFGSQG